MIWSPEFLCFWNHLILVISVGIGRLTNVAHNYNVFIISALSSYYIENHINIAYHDVFVNIISKNFI